MVCQDDSGPPPHTQRHPAGLPSTVHTERLLCQAGHRPQSGERHRVSGLAGSSEITFLNLLPLKMGKLSHRAIPETAQQSWHFTQAPAAWPRAPPANQAASGGPPPPPPPPPAPRLFWPETRRTAFRSCLDHDGGSRGSSLLEPAGPMR